LAAKRFDNPLNPKAFIPLPITICRGSMSRETSAMYESLPDVYISVMKMRRSGVPDSMGGCGPAGSLLSCGDA
jgi:hypothetical protein